MVHTVKLEGFTLQYNKTMGLIGCYGARPIGTRKELENLKAEICAALDDGYKSVFRVNCAAEGNYWEHACF